MKLTTQNFILFFLIYIGIIIFSNLLINYFTASGNTELFLPFPDYLRTPETVRYYTIENQIDWKYVGKILNAVVFTLFFYLVFSRKIKFLYWAILLFVISLSIIAYFIKTSL